MFQRMEQVHSFLSTGAKNVAIAVIGDVMLDKYYYGEVKRISPEAPVPVTRVTGERQTLGGAANVAANLARLGCRVWMGGISGDDTNRQAVCELLASAGIDYSGLIITDRHTIAKLRIVGAHQQMLRLDFEEPGPLKVEEQTKLQAWFENLLRQKINGVILSDYAKGVCTPDFCQYVISRCQQAGIPVLVDPKGADWLKYRGAGFITPNVKELGEAFNRSLKNEDAVIRQYAHEARAAFDIPNLVVTRSERGLSVVNGGMEVHIPTQAREVYDVSGAGDTVAAVFLAAFAAGVGMGDAALLANLAAGVVVSKVGTYAITAEELKQAVQSQYAATVTEGKILAWPELEQSIDQWRAAGDTLVFTNGCFDLLHMGHVTYLQKARKLGDKLILGLNTDASVAGLKGPSRPIVAEMDRAQVMAALECVDAVILFDEETPLELIRRVKPDILVKGGDYKPEEVVGREFAGKVEIIDFEPGRSTTGLIQRILATYKEATI
ncbi:carbohydrate kinase pfkb [Lucifera butyrica]|uniref:Bifunctional protein HldE n=1 Tax=Lucifera butyrica TaxID=1351585 RepID=A0A498RER5_9FIRM|nr:D-glycero-beta-D-manno-heptose-7-phosphate kinase [Lucifera butyrica]VBB09300.1 carbohydrate kinase pfkb [Lucifera butyrica]